MKQQKKQPQVPDYGHEETENPWQRGNLFIAEAECEFAADRGKANITVQCSDTVAFNLAIEELQSVTSRELAVAYAAAHGMGDPRQNGNIIGPFACNEDGVPLDEVNDGTGKPLSAKHPKMQPYLYKVIVPVMRKLI